MLLIRFHIGDQAYVVDAATVRRVLPLPRLRRIAGGPAGLRGVFLYRGAVMPVLDLRALISATECVDALGSRLLLVGVRADCPGEMPVAGLLAERVTAAAWMDMNPPSQNALTRGDAACTGPMVRIDGELTQMIAWDRLLTPEILALGGGEWIVA